MHVLENIHLFFRWRRKIYRFKFQNNNTFLSAKQIELDTIDDDEKKLTSRHKIYQHDTQLIKKRKKEEQHQKSKQKNSLTTLTYFFLLLSLSLYSYFFSFFTCLKNVHITFQLSIRVVYFFSLSFFLRV